MWSKESKTLGPGSQKPFRTTFLNVYYSKGVPEPDSGLIPRKFVDLTVLVCVKSISTQVVLSGPGIYLVTTGLPCQKSRNSVTGFQSVIICCTVFLVACDRQSDCSECRIACENRRYRKDFSENHKATIHITNQKDTTRGVFGAFHAMHLYTIIACRSVLANVRMLGEWHQDK